MVAVTAVQALGVVGQACFFSRFFAQWWASERAKRSVAPPLFWWLSLGGSLAVGLYAYSQHTHVLVVGYVIGALLYARNLWFQRGATRALSSRTATLLALAMAAVLTAAALWELKHRTDPSVGWVVVAGIGQFIWSSRFVVQWWASERAAHSHFPRAFWWLSLAGNALLLAYSVHLQDAVFIAGFVPGPLVQVRNLMLGRSEGRRASATG